MRESPLGQTEGAFSLQVRCCAREKNTAMERMANPGGGCFCEGTSSPVLDGEANYRFPLGVFHQRRYDCKTAPLCINGQSLSTPLRNCPVGCTHVEVQDFLDARQFHRVCLTAPDTRETEWPVVVHVAFVNYAVYLAFELEMRA